MTFVRVIRYKVFWGSIVKGESIREYEVSGMIPYLAPISDKSKHDLAVVVLHEEANIGDGIVLIDYPTKTPAFGQDITIYGHGRAENDTRSESLKEAKMKVAFPDEDRYRMILSRGERCKTNNS